MKVNVRKLMLASGILSLACSAIGLSGLKWRIHKVAGSLMKDIDSVDPAPVVLIFGAYVHPDGRPCPVLQDRLLMGHELYQRGLVPKILLSGDHGAKDYDEVNAMKSYLEQKGVPSKDIFLDHAGFDTYDSLYRARDVFGVKKLILVTQSFHLRRALYIAQNLNLEAQGVASDLRPIDEIKSLKTRELAANVKAFLDLARAREPLLLGPRISLDGASSVTHDKG